MKRHSRFLLIPLVAMILANGCAGVRPTANAADGWTGPLSAKGLSGRVETLAAPRDWRVHSVSSTPATALATEMTLVDLKGPGCVLSFKVGNPSGLLNIAVDDGPATQIRFTNVFGGFIPPFEAPLVGESSLGAYSYVPIPYKSHCVISVQEAEAAPVFEITYADFPPDTAVAPFSIALTGADKGYFGDWRRAFENSNRVRFYNRATEKYHTTSMQLWPHKDERLYALEGPGVITELEMTIDAKDPDILEKVWLEMYWDGRTEPAVVAPVSLLFGAANPSMPDYSTLVFGKSGKRYWCRCPMPYSTGAQVRIVNTSDSKVDFSYGLTWAPGPAHGDLYFHARYNQPAPGAAPSFDAATIQGRGHYVGSRIARRADGQYRFIPVNRSILTDGEAIVSAGNLAKDAHPGDTSFSQGRPLSGGVTDACGATGDVIPFQQSLSVAVTGVTSDAPADAAYSSVTMWYETEPGGKPWVVPGYTPRAEK